MSAMSTVTPPPARRTFLSARGLTKVHRTRQRDVLALRGIDLDLFRGELIVLVGPPGSGKSTLLDLLGGLDTPTDGEIQIHESDDGAAAQRRYHRQHVGFVFQSSELVPSQTARENVANVAADAHRPLQTDLALELVGLDERADSLPETLSPHERQRVAIARALVKRPELLLCDEPTGSLAEATRRGVLEVLGRAQRVLGTTTLIATRDERVGAVADRVIRLDGGCLRPLHRAAVPPVPPVPSWDGKRA